MSPFKKKIGQDHHENWTSNQLSVPFPTVYDTLCLLNMVHEQETSNKGIDIRRSSSTESLGSYQPLIRPTAPAQNKGHGSVGGQQQ